MIKKIFKNKVPFCALLLAGCSLATVSCIDEDLNDRRGQISMGDMEGDNYAMGAFFPSMTDLVVPAQENHYQMGENLIGDIYGRYMMFTNNGWNDSKNPPMCVVPDTWWASPFTYMSEFYAAYNEVKKKTEGTGVNFAWAEILKVSFMHRLTDTYGPIPYTKINSSSLAVAYDSQEDVYKAMFTDLDNAIKVLTSYVQANPEATPMTNYDNVYNGNFTKWVKYANSLKLRMAIRISGVAPELAKEMAEAAINHPIGIITSNEDNASYLYAKGNPIEVMWNSYGDARICADILSYMEGYADNRMDKYFQKHGGGTEWKTTYAAIPSGVYITAQKEAQKFSSPNVAKGDRLIWLTASEMAFCCAEGALLHWDMKGTAAEFYKRGIQLSFEQWGASGADTYMNNDTRKPGNYKCPSGEYKDMNAVSTITIKWNEAATLEEKLERLMTQKWIALYPLGQEAWSEIRRTGYPKVFNLQLSSPEGIKTIPNRMKFSNDEYRNNPSNMDAAVQLLKGEDSFTTKLWWQKK